MNDQKLRSFDDQIVRITTIDGAIFEGECQYNCDEYCEIEFGRKESSLQIDDFLFYLNDIRSIEKIDEKENYIWDGRIEHLMNLDPEPMSMIEKGIKTIELRLYDEKRQKIETGDIIRFTDTLTGDETLRVIVEDIYVFDSFAELYDSLPLLECGYTEDNVEDAGPEDMNIYYSSDRQALYKAVGFRIRVYQ